MTVWYVARAAGLVALMAFTAATALGALASRRTSAADRSLDRRFLTQMAHRSAAVLGLVMLALHTTLIVIDAYVDVSMTSTVLPFTAGYRPVALAAGTLAVYAFVVASVSGALRGRLASSAASVTRWRAVHLSAYLGWTLSMLHGVLAGTDTGESWSTAVYGLCAAVVAVAVGLRLQRRSAGGAGRAATRRLVRSSS